jgi:hypothetical protein
LLANPSILPQPEKRWFVGEGTARWQAGSLSFAPVSEKRGKG